MFSIDTRSRMPIYEQLGQNIIELVASGALAPDDQLPSVRSLARELGVNPNTVQKAYQELETQGFIYQAMGRGSFIAPGDALRASLVEKKLAELGECMTDARRSGATRQQVLTLVETTFEEATR
ncbi:MAG: GntR family transcriptional regulator [Oscillospiraceae bacterium]